jgi:hypothetical protein
MIEVGEAALHAAVLEDIYRHRRLWRARRLNDQSTFYTLGLASYLDLGYAGMEIDEYLAGANSVREVAADAIQEILEIVRIALMTHLGEPVEYPHQLPTPGFHIFIGAAVPKENCERQLTDCGSAHLDDQYRHIPWSRWYASIDEQSSISFTVPLKLPHAGGGLMMWNSLTRERLQTDAKSGRFADLPSAAHGTAARMIPYRVGRMLVHSGQVLHQMAGVATTTVTDERITLQGHGMFADGVWRLYW